MHTSTKIHRVNSLLSAACLTLMFALPIVDLYFWFNFQQTAQLLNPSLVSQLQMTTIRPWQVISAAAFSLSSTMIFVIGLNYLRQLFERFKSAEFFSQNTVFSLYMVAKLLLICAFIRCISSAVLSVLLTWNNPPNERALVISLGSNELWMMILAATFLTIAWSFKEGQRLAQENAEIV